MGRGSDTRWIEGSWFGGGGGGHDSWLMLIIASGCVVCVCARLQRLALILTAGREKWTEGDRR